MDKNVLWYQPAELREHDVILVNGEKVPSGSEYDRYFDELKIASDEVIHHKTPWCGYVSGVFFVKGYFDKTDEHGRPLVFMFISNMQDGRVELLTTIEKLGFKLTPETSQCLERKSIAGIVLISSLILVAIILFILMKTNVITNS